MGEERSNSDRGVGQAGGWAVRGADVCRYEGKKITRKMEAAMHILDG